MALGMGMFISRAQIQILVAAARRTGSPHTPMWKETIVAGYTNKVILPRDEFNQSRAYLV